MNSSIKGSAHQILDYLARKRKTISPLLILPHKHPDPDALASAFALQYITDKAYGISSKIAYNGVIGRMENRAMVEVLKIPVSKLKRGEIDQSSNVALVDTQPAFKNNPFPRFQRASIVIDQHPYIRKPSADLVVINTKCGATSVILAQCLLLLKLKIPVELATALVYGILSDTLHFYRSHEREAIDVYLQILPHSNLKTLAKIQNPDRSRKFFMTLAKGIRNAVVYRNLMVGHLGRVENPDLVSQVADFLLSYNGTAWSFCTGRYQDRLYVSLRGGNPRVSAGRILRDIFDKKEDAGGHDVIAGGSFAVKGAGGKLMWARAEEGLTEKLLNRLRIGEEASAGSHPFREERKRASKGAVR